jgi:methionyl-tRNA synthetase
LHDDVRYHRPWQTDYGVLIPISLTGLDEHGEKIEDNAKAAGVTPQAFVDKVAVKFLESLEDSCISNDDFIRTTQPRHYETVQKIFSRFANKKMSISVPIKAGIASTKNPIGPRPRSGESIFAPNADVLVEEKREPAYFFHCDKYVGICWRFMMRIRSSSPRKAVRAEMVNNFIKPGLNDLCVSRTTFDWGIPVKEAPGHVVYVWLDALTNYITALGYLQKDDSKFQKYWQDPECEIVHVIGADITRFHTIYWPMFLEAMGLREPNRVFVHGLMMMKDGKMSKSKGNTVYAEPLVERYGVDAVRYYLRPKSSSDRMAVSPPKNS